MDGLELYQQRFNTWSHKSSISETIIDMLMETADVTDKEIDSTYFLVRLRLSELREFKPNLSDVVISAFATYKISYVIALIDSFGNISSLAIPIDYISCKPLISIIPLAKIKKTKFRWSILYW